MLNKFCADRSLLLNSESTHKLNEQPLHSCLPKTLCLYSAVIWTCLTMPMSNFSYCNKKLGAKLETKKSFVVHSVLIEFADCFANTFCGIYASCNKRQLEFYEIHCSFWFVIKTFHGLSKLWLQLQSILTSSNSTVILFVIERFKSSQLAK